MVHCVFNIRLRDIGKIERAWNIVAYTVVPQSATPIKGILSHQVNPQMHWDNKILINCSPQERPRHPFYKALFHNRMGGLIRGDINVPEFKIEDKPGERLF